MKNLFEEHEKVTLAIKETIKDKKIVFPAYYGKLYTTLALAHNITLSAEELHCSEMINEKVTRHILTLTECTEEAVTAMEHEDKSTLLKILDETKRLQEEVNELNKIIYEDYLTKSYNRRWLEDTLVENKTVCLRDSGTLALIDINKFKEINDTHGHTVGDKVLIFYAMKFKALDGRVVRYGGDEFIVVFDAKYSFEEIDTKFKVLLSSLLSAPLKAGEKIFHTSFAYGLVSFSKGEDIQKILEKADMTMYEHKKSPMNIGH